MPPGTAERCAAPLHLQPLLGRDRRRLTGPTWTIAPEGGRSPPPRRPGRTMTARRWRHLNQAPGGRRGQRRRAAAVARAVPPRRVAAAAPQRPSAGRTPASTGLLSINLPAAAVLVFVATAGPWPEPTCTGCAAPSSDLGGSPPPIAAVAPQSGGPSVNLWVLSGLVVALVAVVAWGAYRLVRSRGWCGSGSRGSQDGSGGSGTAATVAGGQGSGWVKRSSRHVACMLVPLFAALRAMKPSCLPSQPLFACHAYSELLRLSLHLPLQARAQPRARQALRPHLCAWCLLLQ